MRGAGAARRGAASRVGLLLLLAACGAVPIAASEQRDGDPPRINASNLFEYRHLQSINPEYQEWVAENIKPVPYEIHHAAFSWQWDSVLPAGPDDTKVVMITQLSVSRLAKFRHVVEQWGGPVSVAVYIEYPASSAEAQHCRDAVTHYCESRLLALRRAAGTARPFVLTFLHARKAASGAACAVPSALPSPSFWGRRLAGAVSGARRRLTLQRHAAPEAWRSSPAGRLGRLAHFVSSDLPPQHLGAATLQPSAATSAFAGRFWKLRPTMKQNAVFSEQPWAEAYADLYPVNALRNAAWQQVPAGVFVFLNDIDFIPDAGLYPELVSGRHLSALRQMRDDWQQRQVRRAVVLPAFERVQRPCPGGGNDCVAPYMPPCTAGDASYELCHILDGVKMPRTFEGLRVMLQSKAVDIFHRSVFTPGHGCYSWLAWLQKEHPAEMVAMDYIHPCEPYVIALSDALPRYDERFRGRGQNKVEHLTHMAMWGFRWALLPGHFLVHMPHNVSTGIELNWDVVATPLALMRVKAREIQAEPEYAQAVQLQVPLAEPQDKRLPL